MKTSSYEYSWVRKVLKSKIRSNTPRDVKIKVELILYGLKYRNVSHACRKMGFCRAFFYKWWDRLLAGKFRLRALHEKHRRPKSSPSTIPLLIERRIRHYRKKGFGAPMIQEYLRREARGYVSQKTINHVINNRRPPVRKRRPVKLKKHRKRYELPIPGQRLQVDVKYSPMKVGGKTVYVYVAVDECTRWRYARAYEELNEHWTEDFLEHLKRRMPFPICCIQTDNGPEFTFRLIGGLRQHKMDSWCDKEGIVHRLLPPGMKELNGKVERSHRIDADYFYGSAPDHSLEAFNAALDGWIRDYNTIRPHGGISYLTPTEKLQERLRSLPNEIFTGDLELIRNKFLNSVKLIAGSSETGKVAA
jgi:transposase InsO family protein